MVDQPAGLEVDEHSITVCRYRRGLSKLETRWGTFTDPWTLQPQPKCGFVVVGSEGTISSYDYEDHVGVQTRARPEIHAVPADLLKAPFRSAGRICPPLPGEGSALRGAARSGALPHRAAHRRHRGALGARAPHAGAAAVSAAEDAKTGEPSASDYALVSRTAAEVPAPDLPYLPPMPRDRSVPIALVGAGGISAVHLEAYARHGLNVVAIASRDLKKAEARRDAFFPKARATDDFEFAAARPGDQGARHHHPPGGPRRSDAARPDRGQACLIAEAVRRRPRGRAGARRSWRKPKGSSSRSTRTAAGRPISPISVKPSAPASSAT